MAIPLRISLYLQDCARQVRSPAFTKSLRSFKMMLSKLGIDISKKNFDVALIVNPETMKAKQRQFANTPAGFQALQSWITKQGQTQVHAVMVATGAYGDA